jgi:hypothetical protein
VRKPENTFIKGVEKYLPPDTPYREKMANPYRGGTADSWYSGTKADVWCEYKWIEKLPLSVPVTINLSKLQLVWLKGRHSEGRNIIVVVGSPEGCLLLKDLEWERTDISSTEFRKRSMSRKELANWILKETAGG